MQSWLVAAVGRLYLRSSKALYVPEAKDKDKDKEAKDEKKKPVQPLFRVINSDTLQVLCLFSCYVFWVCCYIGYLLFVVCSLCIVRMHRSKA